MLKSLSKHYISPIKLHQQKIDKYMQHVEDVTPVRSHSKVSNDSNLSNQDHRKKQQKYS